MVTFAAVRRATGGSGCECRWERADLLLDGCAALAVNCAGGSRQNIGDDWNGWMEGTCFGEVHGGCDGAPLPAPNSRR
jgi:hypothetical protein